MRTNRIFVIAGVLLCGLVGFSGCESSELVDIWSDSSFQPPSLHKILVISASKNQVRRRIWEDAFCVELKKHDVTATPSYYLFPNMVPDTNQVMGVVLSKGFDGILVVRWLSSETKTHYLPGYVTKEQDTRYDRRRERFVSYYKEVEHAGYVDSKRVAVRGIDVWATRNDGQIIWSATSRTDEQNSVQTDRTDIVQLVMVELTKQHFITTERK